MISFKRNHLNNSVLCLLIDYHTFMSYNLTMKLNFEDIQKLDRFYRVNLISKISGLRSPFLLGTINEKGQTNLAIFNSIVHLGASPPCLGFIVRPLTVRRDTYDNIIINRHFTINQIPEGIIKEAHQTSAKYETEISEFEACGLTESYVDAFPAPYVKESAFAVGMSYLEEHHITINDTKLIVGQIDHVIIPDEYVDEHGNIDHQALETTVISGLDHYHTVKENVLLDYARQ